MNDIRDRIRDAATAVGETVRQDDLPTEPAALRSRPRRHRPRLVAPLVAAAAVLVVVATTLSLRLTQHTEPTGPTNHLTVPSGGVPGFYLDANQRGRIEVRSVATGEVVSSPGRGVLRGKTSWAAAAAAPDNRHFFLATNGCPPTVYELVIDAGGRVTSFGATRIRVPRGDQVRGMDATDGGGKLALAVGSCRGYKTNGLLLADPGTGSASSWPLGHIRDGYLDAVSVSRDGITMLVSVAHADKGDTFQLIDTASGVRHRVTFRGHFGAVRGVPYQAFITADGRSLVAYLGDPEREGARSGPDYGLVQYTLSGWPTRVLAHWPEKEHANLSVYEGYRDRWLGADSYDDSDTFRGHTDLYWLAGGDRHELPNSVERTDVGTGVFAW